MMLFWWVQILQIMLILNTRYREFIGIGARSRNFKHRSIGRMINHRQHWDANSPDLAGEKSQSTPGGICLGAGHLQPITAASKSALLS